MVIQVFHKTCNSCLYKKYGNLNIFLFSSICRLVSSMIISADRYYILSKQNKSIYVSSQILKWSVNV
jgi:hypothetical protein